MKSTNEKNNAIQDGWASLVEAPWAISSIETFYLPQLVADILTVYCSRNHVYFSFINIDLDYVFVSLEHVRLEFCFRSSNVGVVTTEAHSQVRKYRGNFSLWDEDAVIKDFLSRIGSGDLIIDAVDILNAARGVLKLVIDRAISTRRWIIRARVGSPLEPEMRQIPSDAWKFLQVLDWNLGVATDPTGSRIFSAHLIAAEKAPDVEGLQSVELFPRTGHLEAALAEELAEKVDPVSVSRLHYPVSSRGVHPGFDEAAANKAARGTDAPRQGSRSPTSGAESLCREWLAVEMRTNPDRPRKKEEMRIEAEERFPNLGKRGFDRAWGNAIVDAGGEAWKKPGPRKPR